MKKMSRKYVIPDPDDRSKNDPSIIISNKKVLGLYNQSHEDEDNIQKVTQKVQEWTTKAAKDRGWDGVSFSGRQYILTNEFKE